jgi:uncharacterized protein YkwD
MIYKKSIISLILFGFLIGCGDGATRVLTQVPSQNDDADIVTIATGSNPADYIIPSISTEDKKKFLDAINKIRAEGYDCGTALEKDGGKVVGYQEPTTPLVWNDSLYNSAYEHNYDMINSETFAHEGSGTQYDITGTKLNKKSLPEDRIGANRYFINSTSYTLGENLAEGQDNIDKAITDWLESPIHCENLMSPEFKEMGLSKVLNTTNGKYYWSHEFGVIY